MYDYENNVDNYFESTDDLRKAVLLEVKKLKKQVQKAEGKYSTKAEINDIAMESH